jgi:high-affinity Fe2+/Pb2+ permease
MRYTGRAFSVPRGGCCMWTASDNVTMIRVVAGVLALILVIALIARRRGAAKR